MHISREALRKRCNMIQLCIIFQTLCGFDMYIFLQQHNRVYDTNPGK